MLFGKRKSKSAERVFRTPRGQALDSPEMLKTLRTMYAQGPEETPQNYNAAESVKFISELVMGELADQNGVHIETVLTAYGALAGFATQMGMRESLIKTGKKREDDLFVSIETKNGKRYYLSDPGNEMLFGGPNNLSILGLVGGSAQETGATTFPDPGDLAEHAVKSMGSDAFGVPRLPEQHRPHRQPMDLLNTFWNPVRNIMVTGVDDPMVWPLVIAQTTQQFIRMAKGAIDPNATTFIVMESVVPMAKVDPRDIHEALL